MQTHADMTPVLSEERHAVIRGLAPTKVAVVHTHGDPDEVGSPAIAALFGSVRLLRERAKAQGHSFGILPLRARWPNAHLVPRDQWHAVWALPIPDDTSDMPQADPDHKVTIEVWAYGVVAEIEHRGPFNTEGESVRELHRFVDAMKMRIIGVHEEEYLTPPGSEKPRTVIRYSVA